MTHYPIFMDAAEKTIRFSVPHPPARIWPILSHTDWLNRVLGLPPVSYFSAAMPAGGVTIEARSKLLPGAPIRWKEYPFEWVEGRFFSERRVYLNGPFREFRADFRMEARGGGTAVEVTGRIEPRHALGAVAARILTGKMAWDFRKVRRALEKHLSMPSVSATPFFAREPTDEPLLAEGIEKLRREGWKEPLLEKLSRFLREASDAEVVKIRAFRLAEIWEEDRWEVLRLFLHATRAGLVELSWEILCPNCRGDRRPKGSLSELKGSVHCDTCLISFDGEFDRSVELKFSIHPALRPAPREIFCLGGPGQNAHLAAQLVLEPGRSKVWPLEGLRGRFRLRSPQVAGGSAAVELDGSAGTAAELSITRTGWSRPVPAQIPSGGLAIRNELGQDACVMLEHEAWSRDVATAALVTGWQEFRDLFSKEVLSPGEEITVGCQILLFTDLRGSTSLYQKIGDAPAYSRVRDHFQIIRRILNRHRGGLVKTIGDAIMATFGSVREALEAVVAMEEAVAEAGPAQGGPLQLKAGLHLGPCIAVNANGQLDYFGTTVNLAARLAGLCREREIVLSDDFFQAGECRAFLEKNRFQAGPFEAELRGFAGTKKVWRVGLREGA